MTQDSLRCVQVLQVTEYAPWKAWFVFLLNVVATFSWNYTDLFIMLLSVSLSQRFKQLNHRLRAVKGKAGAATPRARVPAAAE